MLTVEQNDRLSRVGPGTPMGNLLRRYWMPIGAASDLDQDPVKAIRIMGEELVLYKTPLGDYGLMQERCPHRSASMAWGIPTIEGLRCPYHGWMFNPAGRCVEQPFEDTVNPNNTFRDRIKVDAYPVQALGGLLFTYMGPKDKQPLLPRWEPLVKENVHRQILSAEIPFNWLQSMENSMDPVHVEWLHAEYRNYVYQKKGQGPVAFPAKHMRIDFDVFEYGIYKRRLVEGDDPETSPDWLIGHPLLFPNMLGFGQLRTPIDDGSTLFFRYSTTPREPSEPEKIHAGPIRWKNPDGTIEVETVNGGDIMAWVSQGPLTPRHLEHLGHSDKGIILYRRMLSDAIEAVARGEDPPAIVRDPEKNTCISWKTELDMERGPRANFHPDRFQPATAG